MLDDIEADPLPGFSSAEFQAGQLEAIAMASGITIVFCFTSWFLETFSGFPHLSIQWAGILLIFSYGAAAGVLMRRYT